MTKSTDFSAKDAIAHIEELTTLQSLLNFVPDAETRVTVLSAFNEAKIKYNTSIDVKDFVFTNEDLPEDGADVRIRPEPTRPATYGQGNPLPGPKLQGVQFTWGQVLQVDETCANGVGTPETGKVHPSSIAQSPSLFMSEANFQQYQFNINNEE